MTIVPCSEIFARYTAILRLYGWGDPQGIFLLGKCHE